MCSNTDMLKDGHQSSETFGKWLAQGELWLHLLVHECVHRWICDGKVAEILGGRSRWWVCSLGCLAFCLFYLPDFHAMDAVSSQAYSSDSVGHGLKPLHPWAHSISSPIYSFSYVLTTKSLLTQASIAHHTLEHMLGILFDLAITWIHSCSSHPQFSEEETYGKRN